MAAFSDYLSNGGGDVPMDPAKIAADKKKKEDEAKA
jgi:hypothetical protein